MKKLLILLLIVGLCAALFEGYTLVQDKTMLQQGLIRLHVVANSDSESDQWVKLRVKDSINLFLQDVLDEIPDKDQAKAFLQSKLGEIENIANSTLSQEGYPQKVKVTLQEEAFPVREYDTFSLPSGVYDSLRVEIGEGKGHNWWCVVFPNLCAPVTVEAFAADAQQAGLGPELTDALAGEHEDNVRFFILDCIGKLENYFFKAKQTVF